DERQYVPAGGQRWTTTDEINKNHKAVIKKKEPNLFGVGMKPSFGIGQRALLIQSPGGNILWDCISLIDNTLVDLINGLGGLSAIAISHPHYYTAMLTWSQKFGNIPIYLHQADQEWVLQSYKNIEFWSGDALELHDDITLYNLGGHFEGGTVLHWTEGANGEGALLTGDILQVVRDQKHVSFMYSYPNLIPLSAKKVNRMNEQTQALDFDRIYGAWWDRSTIKTGAKKAVDDSAKRYIKAIS